MLYRTDACKGDGVECGRTDGGSKKSGVKIRDAGLSGSRCIPQPPDKKSTAARKDVHRIDRPVAEAVEKQRREGDSPAGQKSVTKDAGSRAAAGMEAGTQAPSVDTKEGLAGPASGADERTANTKPAPKYKDRHKPGYQAQKQREYRARKKMKKNGAVHVPKGTSEA